jgi:FixJ family two-component response regulator
MEAAIYTRNDTEFISISHIIKEEAGLADIYRDPLDGFSHYEHEYDLAVVALEGARGMNVVEGLSERYSGMQIIWITSDEDFLSVAFRHHIQGFVKRPYGEEDLRRAVRQAISECSHRHEWHYRQNGMNPMNISAYSSDPPEGVQYGHV